MKDTSKTGLAKVGSLLLNTVWPFFLKNIWPLVKDQVVDILQKLMVFIGDALRIEMDRNTSLREKEAYARAQQAERKAAVAGDEIEVARYQAQADIWRQVADELRHENERLRQELTDLIATASVQAEVKLRGIQIDVTGETARLIADGKTIALPAPMGE